MRVLLVMVVLLSAAIPPAQVDSTAREARRIDSLRQRDRAASASIVAARRRQAANRRPPDRGPMFGEAPFYGYNWVFYATLVAGVVIGATAVRIHRRDTPVARRAWMTVGALAGGVGAAGVFLACFVFSAFMSVGFSAIPPMGMFLTTFLIVAACGFGVAISPPRR